MHLFLHLIFFHLLLLELVLMPRSLGMLIPASPGLAPNHSDFAAARPLLQSQPKEEQSGLL